MSPFFAEERRLLHAGRLECVDGPDGTKAIAGSIVVHVMLDYSNLSFISAQSPYVEFLRGPGMVRTEAPPARRSNSRSTVGAGDRFTCRGAMPGSSPSRSSSAPSRHAIRSGPPCRATTTSSKSISSTTAAASTPWVSAAEHVRHFINLAELAALTGATYAPLLSPAGFVCGFIAARTPASGRGLLREVRASFYRKLFIAFVAAAVVPVLVLAFVTRAYIATLMQSDLEMEAARTAASASRVVVDVGALDSTDAAAQDTLDDDLVVWLSRVIAQDVNIFDGSGLLASSERNLFVSGLLPERDARRGLPRHHSRRATFVCRARNDRLARVSGGGGARRVQNRDAVLTVPLTLRQQEIEVQIDELDRRVLLGAVLFILLGAMISTGWRNASPIPSTA